MFPLRDSEHSGKTPIVTILIIVLNILFFWRELNSNDLAIFINNYALVPSKINLIDPSTWYPFITSMFLHGGFFHIASNMWFLWIFGDNAEAAMGRFRFLGFYLLSGIVASLVQFLLQIMAGAAIDVPMLGASGAIAGVLGAYLVLFPHAKIETLVPFFGFVSLVTIPATVMLFYWFITQLFNGVASVVSMPTMGGVAWGAHVGGFAFGWLVTRVFYGSRESESYWL